MSIARIPQFIRTVPLRAALIVEFTGLHSDRPQVVVEIPPQMSADPSKCDEPGDLERIDVAPSWIQDKGCQVGDYLMIYDDGAYVSSCPADVFARSYAAYVAPASESVVVDQAPAESSAPEVQADSLVAATIETGDAAPSVA